MINLKILVPQSTTNYCKNPSFEVNTDGWYTYGGSYTVVFTDTFTRANGAIGNGWETTNNAWTISGSAAIATPTLGADLITNGTFAVDASWTKGTGWTIGSNVASHASGTASNLNQNVLTAGNWYKALVDYVTTNGIAAYTIFGSQGNVRTITTTGTKTDVNRAVTTTLAGVRANVGTFVGSVDNISYKLITLSDTMATRSFGVNATLSANMNVNDGTPAGLVGWLDSYTSPANFIIAYHNGRQILLEKCVAGTYTNLITSTVAYVAGAEIRLVGTRSGSNLLLDVFYNGTQVGTQQTVSDAGIIANTRQGMFNTSELNSILDFSITYTNDDNSVATITRTLDRARFGIASGKIVTEGNLINEGAYYKVSWLNGVNDILTASIYARGAGKVRLRLADATTGRNYISNSVALNDDRWTRLEVTGRCSGGTDVRLWVETDVPTPVSQTFYIDGAQIERQPEATSYCDGDQEGCRWNNVRNSTLSTRDANSRAGGRWVPLAGPCRPNNDLYVTVLGGFGMPPVTNNIQSWANAPGAFFQNEKTQNRVVTLSFHVKNANFRTGGSAPSISALNELRQQLIDLIKSDLTLNSEAFLFEYSDSDTGKSLYMRMRYEAGLEGEWDIRNRWTNSFPVRLIAVDPFWSEDTQDVAQLGILNSSSSTVSYGWVRSEGRWKPITTSSGNILSAPVYCFAEAPDGAIYIGGVYATPFPRIVKWDGVTISEVGGSAGANAPIHDIAIGLDGTLYACGTFTSIGGVACNYVAQYNPTTDTWSAMGTGLAGAGTLAGYALCVAPNGQVYVGGDFDSAGGVTTKCIARWDGTQWHTVGAFSGFGGSGTTDVRTIVNAGDGNTLYCGGGFTRESDASSQTLNHVARIDVNTNLISQLGYGVTGSFVYAMTVGLDGTLYAGGNFSESGAPSGEPLLAVAKWSGGQIWEPMGAGFSILPNSSSAGTVYAMATGLNGEIYAAGTQIFYSGDKFVGEVAKWFGGNWNPVEFPRLAAIQRPATEVVYSLMVSSTNELYVGGDLDGPVFYPYVNTVINNGTTSCWPLMYVKGQETVRYIANNKTGQEIFLDLVVFENEEVTIDFARGKITSTIRGNLNYTILSGSEIRSIYLLPGDNEVAILVSEDVGAIVQLRWELQDWSADSVVEPEPL